MSAAAAADAQFRLFETVARCFGRLAEGRPVLVVLDDLHWADEPSLRLLGFLARALTAKAVALLGAYRDAEASPELHKLAGQAQQLPLAGLTPDEVGALAQELAGTRLPAQVTAQLWQRSGGNPFFVRELTRLLAAQGSWQQPTQIPASVAETLRRRLARLSTECVRLLEWAAVAGRDIDVGLLARGVAADHEATAGHEAPVLSLLDEARQAGVIAGSSEPRFTHDLYRETTGRAPAQLPPVGHPVLVLAPGRRHVEGELMALRTSTRRAVMPPTRARARTHPPGRARAGSATSSAPAQEPGSTRKACRPPSPRDTGAAGSRPPSGTARWPARSCTSARGRSRTRPGPGPRPAARRCAGTRHR
jgi:AAA ATPase domain